MLHANLYLAFMAYVIECQAYYIARLLLGNNTNRYQSSFYGNTTWTHAIHKFTLKKYRIDKSTDHIVIINHSR